MTIFSSGTMMFWSTAAFAVAGLGLLGAALWWLVRRDRVRIWLPVVRVLRTRIPERPRLRLIVPPWVSFLAFLLCAIALMLFSLHPQVKTFQPFPPSQERIHIFVDMSPSIAGAVSIFELKTKVTELWNVLQPRGKLTLTTSHDAAILEPKTGTEAGDMIQALGFHRAGIRIGRALQNQLEKVNQIDRLIIVSDRDQHSWAGFNWHFLEDRTRVEFLPLDAQLGAPRFNVFINNAQFLSTSTSQTMDWDVDILRQGAATSLEGTLKVSHGDVLLATIPWEFGKDREHVTVRASWLATKLAGKLPGAILGGSSAGSNSAGGERPKNTNDGLAPGANDSAAPLLWTLELAEPDALSLDNEFRTTLLGTRQDVAVVSEPAGEQVLEDTASSLQVSLDVLGFGVRRFDSIVQPGAPAKAFPLWVLVGGGSRGVDSFCPRSIETLRLAGERGANGAGKNMTADSNTSGAQNSETTMPGSQGPKIWLAPYSLRANFRDLCLCYARLLKSESASAAAPAYCENSRTRDDWVGLLRSLGAKQIGGVIGESAGALAWLAHANSGRPGEEIEVLAFTVPLRPSIEVGLSHGRFPVLIKQMLTWQSLLKPSGQQALSGWPRFSDLAETIDDAQRRGALQVLSQVATSNIPLGESLLAQLPTGSLPLIWSPDQLQANQSGTGSAADEDLDPMPWLRVLLLVVAVAFLIEPLWLGLRFVLKKGSVVGFLLAALAFTKTDLAGAQIQLQTLGLNFANTQFGGLTREVAHRTSIDLAPRARTASAIDDALGQQPWLWARGDQVLSELIDSRSSRSGDSKSAAANGDVLVRKLRPELVTWLKRGGLLIVDDVSDFATLAQVTEAAFAREPTAVSWQPIPPDHEFMRSFYLLDALPGCRGAVWYGLQFDGRLTMLAIPFKFLESLADGANLPTCSNPVDRERLVRIFVNMLMVALATDYKKDQIHLPEILKRLR